MKNGMARKTLSVMLIVSMAIVMTVTSGCGSGSDWYNPTTWGDSALDKAERKVEAAETADTAAAEDLAEAVLALEEAKAERDAEAERMQDLAERSGKLAGDERVAKLTEEVSKARNSAAAASTMLSLAQAELAAERAKASQPKPEVTPEVTPEPTPEPETTPEPEPTQPEEGVSEEASF